MGVEVGVGVTVWTGVVLGSVTGVRVAGSKDESTAGVEPLSHPVMAKPQIKTNVTFFILTV